MNQRNNHLYKSIMESVSKYVKTYLNEMAKPVLRTIDKKLWLTISSIISRNKSTDAEFIKPKGDDKDMLLQRYVAALIINKKPCPKTIKDIEDIKTFKLVGKKVIELGGSIEEILDLYAKNSSGKKIEKTDNKTELKTENTDETSNDDSWFNSDSESDDSYSSSFFDDIENDNSSITDVIDRGFGMLPYDADIKAVFCNNVTPPNINGFKILKNTKDLYQYFYRTEIKNKRNTPNEKLKDILIKNGWKKYEFSLIAITAYSNGYTFLLCKKYDNNIKRNFPIDFNINTTDANIKKQAEEYIEYRLKHEHCVHESMYDFADIDRYKEEFKIYKDFLNTIDNDIIKKKYEESSLYTTILISPDNGMIYTEKMHPLYFVGIQEYDQNKGLYMIPTRPNIYFGTKPLKFVFDCKLEFTGNVNYYDIISDEDNVENIKQKEKDRLKLLKVFTKFKTYVNKHLKISFTFFDKNLYDCFSYNNEIPMFKERSPYLVNKFIKNPFTDIWWQGRDPRQILTSKRQYLVNISKEASKQDPMIMGRMRDMDNLVLLTQYKVEPDDCYYTISLTADGLELFNLIIK